MKRRLFRVVNFLALNLLFFALYLNFIHKDRNAQPAVHAKGTTTVQGTVLVNNPEQYVNKASATHTVNEPTP